MNLNVVSLSSLALLLSTYSFVHAEAEHDRLGKERTKICEELVEKYKFDKELDAFDDISWKVSMRSAQCSGIGDARPSLKRAEDDPQAPQVAILAAAMYVTPWALDGFTEYNHLTEKQNVSDSNLRDVLRTTTGKYIQGKLLLERVNLDKLKKELASVPEPEVQRLLNTHKELEALIGKLDATVAKLARRYPHLKKAIDKGLKAGREAYKLWDKPNGALALAVKIKTARRNRDEGQLRGCSSDLWSAFLKHAGKKRKVSAFGELRRDFTIIRIVDGLRACGPMARMGNKKGKENLNDGAGVLITHRYLFAPGASRGELPRLHQPEHNLGPATYGAVIALEELMARIDDGEDLPEMVIPRGSQIAGLDTSFSFGSSSEEPDLYYPVTSMKKVTLHGEKWVEFELPSSKKLTAPILDCDTKGKCTVKREEPLRVDYGKFYVPAPLAVTIRKGDYIKFQQFQGVREPEQISFGIPEYVIRVKGKKATLQSIFGVPVSGY